MLSEVSSRLKITIVGGSIPERCGDKLYNTCCVFGTDGKLKAKHRKVEALLIPYGSIQKMPIFRIICVVAGLGKGMHYGATCYLMSIR